MNIFFELSSIVVIATLIAFVMRLLKQPLVVGYILTGIVIGPYVLNSLHSVEYIEFLSRIGIAILLFIVGLNLNPLVIKEVGKISLLAGFGQVVFTTAAGYGICVALGFSTIAALYISIALTLSSTIIILKLLSDKGDLDKLYGRISIGILLIQDIVATFLLIVIPTLNSSQQTGLGTTVLILLGKGALAIFLLVLVARYLVPKMSFFFATSQELLFMFSLAWGFGTASLFSMLGFSVEVGALIAGVALSLSPFAYEIGSRMKPLRDFFVMLFFVLLGTHIVVSDIREMLVPVSILIAFVVVGNPLIVFILLNIFGFRRKTSFLTAVTFAQISEFSLILAALGMSLGHISEQVVSLITLVGVVTIAGSTYVIMHAEYLYSHLEWLLKLLEVRRVKKREARHAEGQAEALIFGYDRVGMDFVSAIEKLGTSYLVVDFSPIAIRKLQSLNVPFRYGDAEDVEFLEELNLEGVKIIVSTIPDFEANYLLVRTYRRLNPSGIILVISHDVEEAKKLYLAGASYVIMPHFLGAHYASQMISRHGLDVAEFERERNIHLSKLAKRLA